MPRACDPLSNMMRFANISLKESRETPMLIRFKDNYNFMIWVLGNTWLTIMPYGLTLGRQMKMPYAGQVEEWKMHRKESPCRLRNQQNHLEHLMLTFT